MVERRGRVLVVDDDLDVRELLLWLLEGEGYEVRAAGNGVEALLLMGHWLPNLVVLDLKMPEMDGRTFLTEQHRVAGFADIPVLIVSALHDLARQARGLSAVAVYEKPLQLDDFLAGVRSMVEGSGGNSVGPTLI